MVKLYLILDDEPLTRRNIRLVETEEQAKMITENEPYMGYEEVETMSEEVLKDIICEKRLKQFNIDDVCKFVDEHCLDCETKYNEECPFMGDAIYL